MARPYVARDKHGGWYADVEGVQQDGDPTRTEEQALTWAMERLYHVLCVERNPEHFGECEGCRQFHNISPSNRQYAAMQGVRP